MTLQQDRSTRIDSPAATKITATIGALACAACCALPWLITAGVLTGTGAAFAQNLLLASSGVLVATAGLIWSLHRRRSTGKTAAASCSVCADTTCAYRAAP